MGLKFEFSGAVISTKSGTCLKGGDCGDRNSILDTTIIESSIAAMYLREFIGPVDIAFETDELEYDDIDDDEDELDVEDEAAEDRKGMMVNSKARQNTQKRYH